MTEPSEADVRAALAQLDGSPAAAVALLTDVPVDQLDEYGGVSGDDYEERGGARW